MSMFSQIHQSNQLHHLHQSYQVHQLHQSHQLPLDAGFLASSLSHQTNFLYDALAGNGMYKMIVHECQKVADLYW